MEKLIYDFSRSSLFWEILCGLVVLSLLLVFVSPFHLSTLFNAIALPTWVAVLVSYSPIVWAGIRRRHPTQYERLAAGICAGGIFVIASSITQIYANDFGGQWVYASSIIPALWFFPMIAGVSHEMAAQSLDGRVPTRAMIVIGVYCGIGSFVALSLIAFPLWVTAVLSLVAIIAGTIAFLRSSQ